MNGLRHLSRYLLLGGIASASAADWVGHILLVTSVR